MKNNTSVSLFIKDNVIKNKQVWAGKEIILDLSSGLSVNVEHAILNLKHWSLRRKSFRFQLM